MATAQAAPSAASENLGHRQLPALAQKASDISVRNQSYYIREIRLEAIMLVLAAIGGLFVSTSQINKLSVNIFSVIVILAFLISMGSHAARWASKPNKRWYSGRAIAESAKTVSWRYAVGGLPFNKSPNDAQTESMAEQEFAQQFKQLAHQAQHDGLHRVARASGDLTPALRDVRARSLEDRREIYRQGRIQDQIDWYTNKSDQNRKAANLWGVVMLLLEASGALLALLHFVYAIPNLFGIIAAATAAVGTWLQLKQHQMLAQSYSVAAKDLELIAEKFPPLTNTAEDEANWAKFVDDAEAAISREHTLWSTAHADAARVGGPRTL